MAEAELAVAKTTIDDHCLKFCMALLKHPLGKNEYASALISGLAVLGVRASGGWLSAEDYTSTLSSIIKLARLMVLQYASGVRAEEVKRLKSVLGYTDEMAEEKADEGKMSAFKVVQRTMHRYMMRTPSMGTPAPMNWMLDARTYGMKIRYSTMAQGVIGWKDGDTILYQDVQLGMTQLRAMVQGLVTRSRRKLMEDLLMLKVDRNGDADESSLPKIEWEKWCDNPANDEVGWSF